MFDRIEWQAASLTNDQKVAEACGMGRRHLPRQCLEGGRDLELEPPNPGDKTQLCLRPPLEVYGR